MRSQLESSRLWKRLSERAKPPRSWWFPHRGDPALSEMAAEKVQQDYLEISSNIAKTVVTIVAFSFFCVFTLLGAPDRELVAAGAQITIPVAKVGVSFKGFLVLGPLLLIAFFIHLHIFVAYWLALREVADNPRRGAYIFNLPFFSTGFLSSILFYWLVPAVIGVFAWKAAPQPFAGRILFATFLAITAWSSWAQIRRRPESKRGWNAPLWALLVATGLALASSSSLFPPNLDLYGSIRSVRGGMSLVEVDLAGQDLSGRFLEDADLTEASLVGANLTNARLSDANLVKADLRGADLSGADLRRANLTDAILDPLGPATDPGDASEVVVAEEPTKLKRAKLVDADLVDAKLKGARLSFADLTGADLTRADLGESASGRSASLSRAILREADLGSAVLQRTDLRGAILVQADMTDAKMQGALLYPADDGTPSDLTEAVLQKANLSGAVLSDAIVRGANLKDADLSGAVLTTAVRLSRQQLANACLGEADKPAFLPEGLDGQPPPCKSETGNG